MSAVSDVTTNALTPYASASLPRLPRTRSTSTLDGGIFVSSPFTCVRCAEIVLGMASVRNWSDACATILLGSATIEAIPSAVVAAGRSSWRRCPGQNTPAATATASAPSPTATCVLDTRA